MDRKREPTLLGKRCLLCASYLERMSLKKTLQLIEVMEYEREHGHSAVITVSTRAVPRILGKGGKQATQIKEESGITDLDVQRGDSSSDITIRGTVRAVAAARKLISQIASEADDDTTIEVSIDPSFHQVLIGKGGAKSTSTSTAGSSR